MKENPTLRLLHQRASLRVYDKRDISQETLDQILQAMMRAPTAGNQMLYSVIVVRDDVTKQKLAQSCDHQAFIATAPVLLIFLADHQRWFDYYRQNDVAGYCNRHGLRFEAPQESDLLLAIEDAMIAAQNAVIAAESLGIGSCYIGDIMENYEFHRELFDLPDWAFPIGMLCLGYYRENHLKKLRPRFEQQYIVFDEKYRHLSADEYEQMFAEQAKSFFFAESLSCGQLCAGVLCQKNRSCLQQGDGALCQSAMKQWDGRLLNPSLPEKK